MKNNLIYSLKVWLTSVFTAPLLILIADSFGKSFVQRDASEIFTDFLSMYSLFVVFGGLCSAVTWIIFLLAINITTNKIYSVKHARLIISVLGVLLTIGTFTIIMGGFSTEAIGIMLAYGLGIWVGSWIYKLEIEEKPDVEILINEQ